MDNKEITNIPITNKNNEMKGIFNSLVCTTDNTVNPEITRIISVAAGLYSQTGEINGFIVDEGNEIEVIKKINESLHDIDSGDYIQFYNYKDKLYFTVS